MKSTLLYGDYEVILNRIRSRKALIFQLEDAKTCIRQVVQSHRIADNVRGRSTQPAKRVHNRAETFIEDDDSAGQYGEKRRVYILAD